MNRKNVTVVEAALDVNGDGNINLKDVFLLLKYVNQKPVTIY